MEMIMDLKQEWDQIFNECWRQMKYFFYVRKYTAWTGRR